MEAERRHGCRHEETVTDEILHWEGLVSGYRRHNPLNEVAHLRFAISAIDRTESYRSGAYDKLILFRFGVRKKHDICLRQKIPEMSLAIYRKQARFDIGRSVN